MDVLDDFGKVKDDPAKARGLQPRRGAIAPVGPHRELEGACAFASASWAAWAETAHPACHRSRSLGAGCQAPYAAPANVTPQIGTHTSILGTADIAGC